MLVVNEEPGKKKRNRLIIAIFAVVVVVLVAATLYILSLPSESENGPTELYLTYRYDCDNNVVAYRATQEPIPDGTRLKIYLSVYEHYDVITLDYNLSLTDGRYRIITSVEPVPDFPEGVIGLATYTINVHDETDVEALWLIIHSCS